MEISYLTWAVHVRKRTIEYVRPERIQISSRIRAVWS